MQRRAVGCRRFETHPSIAAHASTKCSAFQADLPDRCACDALASRRCGPPMRPAPTRARARPVMPAENDMSALGNAPFSR